MGRDSISLQTHFSRPEASIIILIGGEGTGTCLHPGGHRSTAEDHQGVGIDQQAGDKGPPALEGSRGDVFAAGFLPFTLLGTGIGHEFGTDRLKRYSQGSRPPVHL